MYFRNVNGFYRVHRHYQWSSSYRYIIVPPLEQSYGQGYIDKCIGMVGMLCKRVSEIHSWRLYVNIIYKNAGSLPSLLLFNISFFLNNYELRYQFIVFAGGRHRSGKFCVYTWTKRSDGLFFSSTWNVYRPYLRQNGKFKWRKVQTIYTFYKDNILYISAEIKNLLI